MKHFFDNVRDNNKTMESLEEEKDALRTDVAYLHGQCRNDDAATEKAGDGIFGTDRTRLFSLMHSL